MSELYTKSSDPEIIQERLDSAAEKIQAEMLNILPPKSKLTS